MSYNVRLFNKYRWIDKPNISEEIEKLILEEDPDIVCIQEYSNEVAPELNKYKFSYKYPKFTKAEKSTVAIFSKFKIKKTKDLLTFKIHQIAEYILTSHLANKI